MVEHQTLYELSVSRELVNHVHNFNHVKIDRLIRNSDNVDCINNDVHQLIGQVRMQLAAEGSSGSTDENRLLYSFFRNFESV